MTTTQTALLMGTLIWLAITLAAAVARFSFNRTLFCNQTSPLCEFLTVSGFTGFQTVAVLSMYATA